MWPTLRNSWFLTSGAVQVLDEMADVVDIRYRQSCISKDPLPSDKIKNTRHVVS